jgi:hypothetical protein
MSLYFLKIFSLALSLLFQAPEDSVLTEKMSWNEKRKLSWRDFKGTPQAVSDYVASTHSGISFSYSFTSKGNKVTASFMVESHFYPDLSWYLPKQVNDFILAHEQTHFDISELHARKLRKELSQYQFGTNSKTEVEHLYKEVERQRGELQRKYDEETDHSRNKTAELEWRRFIASELQRYDRWK